MTAGPVGEESVWVEGLCRSFGDFLAVDHLGFSVKKGEIFGFLGANGAGKTTTIRMLCGLLSPTSGSGRVAGYDIQGEAEKIKKSIGYMSQKFSLYEDLSSRENLEFYGAIYGLRPAALRGRIAAMASELDFASRLDTLVADLPLGWKQRIALGSALIHDPPIIFLDEPTSGVDPASRRSFWLLIHRLAEEGKTVFVSTHYMDEAEYCSRVSIMKDGRILVLANPRRLKEESGKASIQEVFLSLVGGNGDE